METGLILYTIYASALLIWSTSRGNNHLRPLCPNPAAKVVLNNDALLLNYDAPNKDTLTYVLIPGFLLNQWIACSDNLLVFDLHSPSESGAGQERFSEMLTVSMQGLRNLVTWIPPCSRVVFSCSHDFERFDAHIENKLLELGIAAVYLFDRNKF